MTVRRLVPAVRVLSAATVAAVLLAPLAASAQTVAARFTVTSTADAGDAAPGDKRCADAARACTLRAAIDEANALDGLVTVKLPAGTIVVGAPIAVTGDVEVTGAGVDASRIDLARGPGRFRVDEGDVTLAELTVSGGRTADGGGAAVHAIDSRVALRNAVVAGASADGDGAALAVFGGSVSIVGSTLRNNAGENGGALFTLNAGVRIETSELRDNGASGSGGAAFLSFPVYLGIDDVTFAGNVAGRSGGAIYVEGHHGDPTGLLITNARFERNFATSSGGAVYVASTSDGHDQVRVTIAASSFTENRALRGGGVHQLAGLVTVDGSTFTSNRAAGGGGGAISSAGDLTIESSTFATNAAEGAGGAVAASGIVRIGKSTFRSNHSDGLGGGLALTGDTKPALTDLTHDANTAADGEPDVWRDGRDLPMPRAVGAGAAPASRGAARDAADAGSGGVPVVPIAAATVLVGVVAALIWRRTRRRDVPAP